MKIIAASGASHSAKSTFAQTLKELYPEEVMLQDEIPVNDVYNIKRTKPIDELRKNPFEYFEYEKIIIMKKILQEEVAALSHDDYNNKIVIFERSLADSFYYLTNFTDVSNFNSIQIKEYNNFLDILTEFAKSHYSSIYNKIFIFKPVYFEELNDERRAKNLKNDHYNEYKRIEVINHGFMDISGAGFDKIDYVDMGSVKIENLRDYVDNIYTYKIKGKI